MQLTITIKERGAVGRNLKKAHNAASKRAWVDSGTMWHRDFRDKRFSKAHALKAGYKLRKGEQSGLTKGEFWRSYTGQKLKKWHHKNPLQWSGETRNRVKSASITSTATQYFAAGAYSPGGSTRGGGCKVAYAGASKLNFRAKGSDINMADEFRRIIPDEATAIAKTYDAALDAGLKQDNSTTVTKVA